LIDKEKLSPETWAKNTSENHLNARVVLVGPDRIDPTLSSESKRISSENWYFYRLLPYWAYDENRPLDTQVPYMGIGILVRGIRSGFIKDAWHVLGSGVGSDFFLHPGEEVIPCWTCDTATTVDQSPEYPIICGTQILLLQPRRVLLKDYTAHLFDWPVSIEQLETLVSLGFFLSRGNTDIANMEIQSPLFCLDLKGRKEVVTDLVYFGSDFSETDYNSGVSHMLELKDWPPLDTLHDPQISPAPLQSMDDFSVTSPLVLPYPWYSLSGEPVTRSQPWHLIGWESNALTFVNNYDASSRVVPFNRTDSTCLTQHHIFSEISTGLPPLKPTKDKDDGDTVLV